MIPYAREAGALLGLALWAGSLWLAYDYGGSEAEADAAKVALEAERDANKALRDEVAKRDAVAAKLAEALRDRPQAGVTIREVVRTEPSKCPVPAAGSVRQAIREANASR